MNAKLLQRVNHLVGERFGVVALRRSSLYPWQAPRVPQSIPPRSELPEGAGAYLRQDHPRLAELQRRYAAVDPRVTSPLVWKADTLSADELQHFRGDNAYVWQRRGLNQSELAYTLTYYYVKSAPEGRLLAILDEDTNFGLHALDIDGRIVSRDLLDSAREIEFLTTHVKAEGRGLRILDIGAGYGRLSYRIHQALADAQIFAMDAFPQSTFLAEYYLGFRGCDRAKVVPLDEVDIALEQNRFDVAINIHSFSECTPDAIRWWIERLARHGVQHLMVVPNGDTNVVGMHCYTNDGRDMEAIFSEFGYKCVVREPRYLEPTIQKYGVDPASLNLFSLE